MPLGLRISFVFMLAVILLGCADPKTELASRATNEDSASPRISRTAPANSDLSAQTKRDEGRASEGNGLVDEPETSAEDSPSTRPGIGNRPSFPTASGRANSAGTTDPARSSESLNTPAPGKVDSRRPRPGANADVRNNSSTSSPTSSSSRRVTPSGKTGTEIGDTIPQVEGRDIEGVKFSLSDYRGKVVMLDFWGDW